MSWTSAFLYVLAVGMALSFVSTDDNSAQAQLTSQGSQLAAIAQNMEEISNSGVDTVARAIVQRTEPLSAAETRNAAAAKIRAKHTPTTLTFAVMTDTHCSGLDTNKDVKQLTANEIGRITKIAPIDFIANAGDYVDGNKAKADTLSDLNKLIVATNQNAGRIPTFYARGNHDDNGWFSEGGCGTYLPSEMINDVEWYQNVFSFSARDLVTDPDRPYGGYGYYDHAQSKIRVFVVNTEDIPYVLDNGHYRYNAMNGHSISNAQLNFIANALLFTDKSEPNEWAALFIMHVPPDTSTDSGYRFGVGNAPIRGHEMFFGIVQAYKNGSSFAYSDSSYNPSLGDVEADFPISISIDYSSKGAGDVIGFFSGHTHTDNFCRTVGHPGSLSRGYAYFGLSGETGFTTFLVDRTNNKVSAIKCGAVTVENGVGVQKDDPDEGSISSGEYAVNISQFRPTGETLFNGWDSAGPGYNFRGNPGISLDTMEVLSKDVDAPYILTKAIPVKPFTRYAIPSTFNGSIDAYTSEGDKSSSITPTEGDGYKVITTDIRQYYLVFSCHMSSYVDYENFKIKEIYSGLVF